MQTWQIGTGKTYATIDDAIAAFPQTMTEDITFELFEDQMLDHNNDGSGGLFAANSNWNGFYLTIKSNSNVKKNLLISDAYYNGPTKFPSNTGVIYNIRLKIYDLKIDKNTYINAKSFIAQRSELPSIYNNGSGIIDVSNNIFYGGIGCYSNTSINIINNTFIAKYNSYVGYYSYIDITTQNDNIGAIKNNIMYYNFNAQDDDCTENIFLNVKSVLNNISIDNNIYYSIDNIFGYNYLNTTYTGFSNWQVLGFDANSQFINPMLTNINIDDYTLQEGSPAIDSGVTIIDITNDFIYTTRPQGSAFDIGAYEYQSQDNNQAESQGCFKSPDAFQLFGYNSALDNEQAITSTTVTSAMTALDVNIASQTGDPLNVTIDNVDLINVTIASSAILNVNVITGEDYLPKINDYQYDTLTAGATAALTHTLSGSAQNIGMWTVGADVNAKFTLKVDGTTQMIVQNSNANKQVQLIFPTAIQSNTSVVVDVKNCDRIDAGEVWSIVSGYEK